ncbi:MAG: hypothetical protein ACYC5Q_11155 [Thermoleophilia bacterium]
MLARKGDTVAAFAFTKQEYGNPEYGNPDVAEFDYVSRDDGGTELDRSHPSVRSGHGVTTDSCVEIGGLRVEWSYRSRATGWVYFEHLPHEVPAADALELCVTYLWFMSFPIDTRHNRFKWQVKP